jgi:magnesium-transporting ATPase (P-type)
LVFAIYDTQYLRKDLMSQPKLYKLGLKNQCFSTGIFWQWIIKGILQGGLIFYMSFVPFTWGGSWNGKLGDLWMSGTCAYGAVVILVNMTMLHDSYSHTIWSVLIIILSVSFFFIAFYICSFVGLPILDGMFAEIISFPIFIYITFYFVLFAFPTDGFIHFMAKWQKERELQVEKEEKRRKKKKFTKGLDATKLAPIHRCKFKGFS